MSNYSHGESNLGFDPGVDSLKNQRTKDKAEANHGLPIEMYQLTNDNENELSDGEEKNNLGFLSFFQEGDGQMAKVVKDFRENSQWKKWQRLSISMTILGSYIAYVIAVIVVHSKLQDTNYWCSGDGLLYILTAIIFAGLLYFKIIAPFLPKTTFYKNGLVPCFGSFSKFLGNRVIATCIKLVLLGGVIAFYVLDTADERERLISFLGLFFLLGFAYIFSFAPRKVVWRFTIWGMCIQFILALIVLRWPLGNKILQCLSYKVSEFLDYATEGAQFVFSFLSSSRGPFAFTVLPVTIFFSFFTNILYYFGVVQWVVIKLGWVIQKTVGTSLCESMNAAGSIFLGQTEAPLLVKPYLPIMTNSEIHAVMTAGFATIAGSVLAAYTNMGADPALLITASFMNAPAALAFSKLFYPDLRKSRIDAKTIQSIKSTEVNALHAGCVGVSNAIPLVANIAANLIAFISFIAFFNAVFDWSCQLVSIEEGTCSLESIFGYVFMPLAWMMGVQWSDCYEVGQLLGLKIAVNEFVAYSKLMEFVDDGVLSERSEAIATFALCGFGNLSSVGIVMGGLGPLAPARKDDMAKIAFRAMIAGSMATFSSACIAGTLMTFSTIDGGFVGNLTTTIMPSTIQ